MTSHTAREPLLKHLIRPEVMLPLATSVALAGGGTFFSMTLMNKTVSIPQPWIWVIAVLALMVLNILSVILLEPERAKLGSLTLPAMLGSVAIVMMYIFSQTLNRYMLPVGYSWLLPFVIAGLGLCYCGLFGERSLFLKAYLAVNGLALTVIWCLGAADKLALPF